MDWFWKKSNKERTRLLFCNYKNELTKFNALTSEESIKSRNTIWKNSCSPNIREFDLFCSEIEIVDNTWVRNTMKFFVWASNFRTTEGTIENHWTVAIIDVCFSSLLALQPLLKWHHICNESKILSNELTLKLSH